MVTVALDLPHVAPEAENPFSSLQSLQLKGHSLKPCLILAVAAEFLGSQVSVYKDDFLLSKCLPSHLADCPKEFMLLIK